MTLLFKHLPWVPVTYLKYISPSCKVSLYLPRSLYPPHPLICFCYGHLSVLSVPIFESPTFKAIPMSPAPGSPPAPYITNSLLLATGGRCYVAGSGYSQEAEFKSYLPHHQ